MNTRAVEVSPLAQTVRFTDHELIVSLVDGRTLTVPSVWFPRLADATPAQLRQYELLGDGEGIHWPELDEDLSVEGLLLGVRRGQMGNSNILEASKNKAPNIFDYATKELSQDAMICWLLEWSGHRNRSQNGALHDCGVRFARALMEKHGANLDGKIKKVEILRQERKIDILMRINDKQVILIEDKTDTKDRDKQLREYYDAVVKGYTRFGEVVEEHLYPVYLKTGNQPLRDDRRIEKDTKYRVFDRADILNVLNSYEGCDSILMDFRRHLQGWEDETNSYAKWTKDGEQDCLRAWEGFYRRLEYELDASTRRTIGWEYVPKGDFLGFYWWPSDNDELYLQIEGGRKEAKLCFKVDAGGDGDWQEHLKWHWHARVLAVSEKQVVRPDKMRKGKTMTVAWWNDWLAFDADGKLDVSGTVENLKRAEGVLKQALEA